MDARGSGGQDAHGGSRLVGDGEGRYAALHDAGLVHSDLLHRVAQQTDVVQAERRDAHRRRVPQVVAK